MNRYVITLAYDGSSFGGWQTQRRGDSVQEALAGSFYDTFKIPVRLIAASRTDVGVHALGQVVLCLTELDLAVDRLLKVWNDNLPATITIRNIKKAENQFHPWYNVYKKVYYYHLFCSKPIPFLGPYGWHVKAPVDWNRVKQALDLLVGEHDFRGFKHAEDERRDTIKRIYRIDLSYHKRYGFWRVQVSGNAFLRHMIRKMVGAALFLGMHTDLSIDALAELLKDGVSSVQFPTAPAKGLLLRSIQYKEVVEND